MPLVTVIIVPRFCQFPRRRRVKLVTCPVCACPGVYRWHQVRGSTRVWSLGEAPWEVVLTAESESQRRVREYEREVVELHEQTKLLEEEVVNLRRRLQNAPKRVSTLEEKLLETKGQLAQAISQNEKLTYTLREAREHIAALREEVEKLTQPPSAYGTFLGLNDDGTADVFSAGRKMRVSLHPELEETDLRRGHEVVLNESLNVILARNPELSGEVVTLKEVLDDGLRALIVGRADEERVVEIADELLDVKIRAGDSLLMDSRTGLLLEKLPRPEVEELILEEVPDITYEDVGGLDTQIEAIMDAVELPYLHRDLFTEHKLPAPKGILLYGPPGCGKTLIAKAVANSLAKKVAQVTGDKSARSYFLNIKGPELLNKYVGETERQIRLVFQRAREKSEEGVPVIVFFDEMDSLFRTRGTGISSDMESTIVPQLLAEIDGVETLRNVIVIGASNREDLIDPAILRPGRLDVKIKIERPDEQSAAQIFARYLTADLPLEEAEVTSLGGGDREKAVRAMIEKTVEAMYLADDDNRFLEVTYQNGDKEIMYFKDFSSGAMIENIVRRAKKLAIKRTIAGEGRGIRVDDLLASIKQEYKEHEDLPNTTNPDDWAKISGKKGERIVYVRTLISHGPDDATGGRSIERVATGQYL
ncbi:MAG: proteasome ATPase [Actinobacteria bacterium]|nr:proteasome ATPase [Actinomycetota bacterium]